MKAGRLECSSDSVWLLQEAMLVTWAAEKVNSMQGMGHRSSCVLVRRACSWQDGRLGRPYVYERSRLHGRGPDMREEKGLCGPAGADCMQELELGMRGRGKEKANQPIGVREA